MQEIKKINLSLEWKSCKIEDVVSVRRGSSPRPIKDYVSETGMPWVKIADATKDQTRFINFTSEFIKEEGIEKSVVVNPGDLIVSNSATPGLPKFMNIKACVHDGWLVFDSYNGILKDFLYYYFIVIRGRLVNQANGSVFKNLKTDIVRNFDINLPDLETQEKIVKILSQIDKKIETTIKINKNLFNIIDFIFKDYVGDYEDLEIVSLSENTQEIIRGFNSKYVEKSNIKNFNQKVNKGTFLEKQHFKYLDENIEIPKAKFAKKRDVLVNSLGDGTVGRPHYYNEDTDNVVVDQHITIIRANEDLIPSTYIYEYLKNSTGQYHLDSLISGSTGMLMLNISEIRNLKIPILDKKNLREFDTTVTPLFDKITKNFEEIYCLSKLRDTLLPKLMSGEIDVSKINCDLELRYNYMKYLFNQIHTPMSKSVV